MLKENRFRFSKTGIDLLDRAVESFVVFPYNPSYVDKIIDEISYDLLSNYGTSIVHSPGAYDYYYIKIESKKIGTFTKNFEICYGTCTDNIQEAEVTSEYYCSCMLYDDCCCDNDISIHYDGGGVKKEIDFVCQCLVPYYATNGEYVEGIPLVLNLMPEFVRDVHLKFIGYS